jgi:hypothetical protein
MSLTLIISDTFVIPGRGGVAVVAIESLSYVHEGDTLVQVNDRWLVKSASAFTADQIAGRVLHAGIVLQKNDKGSWPHRGPASVEARLDNPPSV